jgi:hypothetical protein
MIRGDGVSLQVVRGLGNLHRDKFFVRHSRDQGRFAGLDHFLGEAQGWGLSNRVHRFHILGALRHFPVSGDDLQHPRIVAQKTRDPGTRTQLDEPAEGRTYGRLWIQAGPGKLIRDGGQRLFDGDDAAPQGGSDVNAPSLIPVPE